jgi:hypothetical protein
MNVSFGNIITYPENIKCDCGKDVKPYPKNIDSSTWDLKCDCGLIAYLHPKREERWQQIQDMLD